MTRRRSRRSGGGRSWPGLLVCLVVVVAVLTGSTGLRSAAFPATTVTRGAAVDVTADDSGAHSLDVAGSVRVNATRPLVNVTNRLDRTVSVTASLRPGSTGLGTLAVGGVEGDAVTVALAPGETRTVEMTVPNDGSLAGETVYFDVDASASGLDVNAPNRSVPIAT